MTASSRSSLRMNNGIDELLDSEKVKFEQRIRRRKITRQIGEFLLLIFLGIGVASFISLSIPISRQSFWGVSASILAYSLLSGFVEYVKTKTDGHQKAVLFVIIQLLLFALVSVLMISLLKD